MKYTCKISLIGNEHVGKTSLILRYISNTFSPEYKTTLGADFVDKTYTNAEVSVLGKNDSMAVTFWDMAGQSHYIDVAALYLEGSTGVIIVFDQNSIESFHGIAKWKKYLDQICPNSEIMIVGNKCDLDRKINHEEISALESELGLKIEFSSAKTNENVGNMFEKMVAKIVGKCPTKKK